MSDLIRYLREYCTEHPATRMPLADLVFDFRRSLSIETRRDWPRDRIQRELVQGGFPIGVGEDKRTYVGGVAPRGKWREIDGKLELAPNV